MMRWMPLSVWFWKRATGVIRRFRLGVLLPLSAWLYAKEAKGAASVAHDHDLARVRLAICARCPLFNRGVCDRSKGGCGCYMPIKARFAQATCPKGRW